MSSRIILWTGPTCKIQGCFWETWPSLFSLDCLLLWRGNFPLQKIRNWWLGHSFPKCPKNPFQNGLWPSWYLSLALCLLWLLISWVTFVLTPMLIIAPLSHGTQPAIPSDPLHLIPAWFTEMLIEILGISHFFHWNYQPYAKRILLSWTIHEKLCFKNIF